MKEVSNILIEFFDLIFILEPLPTIEAYHQYMNKLITPPHGSLKEIHE
jgi:hypothetical protein